MVIKCNIFRTFHFMNANLTLAKLVGKLESSSWTLHNNQSSSCYFCINQRVDQR